MLFSSSLLALVAHYAAPSALAGIEIREPLIANAQALLAPVAARLPCTLAPYDGQRFPAWLADYDTVLLIDVLHHVPADRQAPHEAVLRQFRRQAQHGRERAQAQFKAGVEGAQPAQPGGVARRDAELPERTGRVHEQPQAEGQEAKGA